MAPPKSPKSTHIKTTTTRIKTQKAPPAPRAPSTRNRAPRDLEKELGLPQPIVTVVKKEDVRQPPAAPDQAPDQADQGQVPNPLIEVPVGSQGNQPGGGPLALQRGAPNPSVVPPPTATGSNSNASRGPAASSNEQVNKGKGRAVSPQADPPFQFSRFVYGVEMQAETVPGTDIYGPSALSADGAVPDWQRSKLCHLWFESKDSHDLVRVGLGPEMVLCRFLFALRERNYRTDVYVVQAICSTVEWALSRGIYTLALLDLATVQPLHGELLSGISQRSSMQLVLNRLGELCKRGIYLALPPLEDASPSPQSQSFADQSSSSFFKNAGPSSIPYNNRPRLSANAQRLGGRRVPTPYTGASAAAGQSQVGDSDDEDSNHSSRRLRRGNGGATRGGIRVEEDLSNGRSFITADEALSNDGDQEGQDEAGWESD